MEAGKTWNVSSSSWSLLSTTEFWFLSAFPGNLFTTGILKSDVVVRKKEFLSPVDALSSTDQILSPWELLLQCTHLEGELLLAAPREAPAGTGS